MIDDSTNFTAKLLVSFDRSTGTLAVLQLGECTERKLLTLRLTDQPESVRGTLEQTLGQLILHALNRLTPGGLRYGDYASLFDRIAEENFVAFCDGLDLEDADDLYALGSVLFAHARRKGSWTMVEGAIGFFQRAADREHALAKRFLGEDLPVVLPRLRQKLQP